MSLFGGRVNLSSADKKGLSFNILPAMPRLEVELAGLPDSLVEGELHQLSATLRNAGASPLHAIRLIVTHPDILCAPSNQDPNLCGSTPGSAGVWSRRLGFHVSVLLHAVFGLKQG